MDTEDLGVEAGNPFVLFLILILLLAANGAFERAVSFVQDMVEAAKSGAKPKSEAAKTCPSRSLGYGARNVGRKPILGKILPLGVGSQNPQFRSWHKMLK